jgi:hypothetical protein
MIAVGKLDDSIFGCWNVCFSGKKEVIMIGM